MVISFQIEIIKYIVWWHLFFFIMGKDKVLFQKKAKHTQALLTHTADAVAASLESSSKDFDFAVLMPGLVLPVNSHLTLCGSYGTIENREIKTYPSSHTKGTD